MGVRVLFLASLLVLPAASNAEELVLSLETEGSWTDNLSFGGASEDAFSIRFSPRLELGRSRGDLSYDLRYRLTYEDYLDRSDADTVDQMLDLRGSYHVSEATRITLTERFAREQSLSQRADEADPNRNEIPDLESRRQRFIRNAASVGVSHLLSRRWTLSGDASHNLFDFRDEESVDSNSYSGSGRMEYALSKLTRVGFGFGATRQDFEETDLRPGGQTDYYRVFGSWSREFSPTLSVAVQAGPTWIRSDSDGPEGSQGRFTYFGEGSLDKRWETVRTSLRYSRSESTSSGASGGTVADTVTGSVSWRPSQRWSFALNASWARREAATDQTALEFVEIAPGSFLPVPRQIETSDSVDQWNLTLVGDRRLTRYLSVLGRVSWLRQERNVDSFTSSSQDTDRFQVFLGLRWRSKPFLF